MNKVFSFIWKNRSFIMLAIIALLIVLYLKQCGDTNYQIKKGKQNVEALTDSLETIKQRNGEIITQKASLLADKEELKELNKNLSDEVETLKKEGSDPKTVVVTKVEYRDTGSIENKLLELDSNKYSLNFSYVSSENIINIKGSSIFNAHLKKLNEKNSKLEIEPGKTKFDEIKVSMGLVLGIKEDKDGIDRVFAKPKPYTDKVTFTELDAVQLEEYYKSKYNDNKKGGRLSLGLYGGYGVSSDHNGVLRLGPQIGVGLNYRLVKIPFF